MEPTNFGQAELQKVKDWFDEKAPDYTCPICKGEDFGVAGMMRTPEVIYEHGGLTDTTNSLTMVALTCQNCAYAMLFSARRMGLVE